VGGGKGVSTLYTQTGKREKKLLACSEEKGGDEIEECKFSIDTGEGRGGCSYQNRSS